MKAPPPAGKPAPAKAKFVYKGPPIDMDECLGCNCLFVLARHFAST